MEHQIGITLAKNFPTFAPVGPWLVTSEEIVDPQQLTIELRVNGERRQHASTADMIFPVAELIAYWSQVGLQTGDMITDGNAGRRGGGPTRSGAVLPEARGRGRMRHRAHRQAA